MSLKCDPLMTPMSPLTVQNMSPIFEASFMGITENPSMTASRALRASTSVTMTFAPIPLARMATPRPHQP